VLEKIYLIQKLAGSACHPLRCTPVVGQSSRGPIPRLPPTTGYGPTNLDTARIPPATNGWGTKYSILDTIPPLLAKGGDHQPKRTKPGHDLYQSFYPTSMVMGGQYLATCQHDLIHPCAPAQHALGTLVAMPGRL
jgi:hypothetical protein